VKRTRPKKSPHEGGNITIKGEQIMALAETQINKKALRGIMNIKIRIAEQYGEAGFYGCSGPFDVDTPKLERALGDLREMWAHLVGTANSDWSKMMRLSNYQYRVELEPLSEFRRTQTNREFVATAGYTITADDEAIQFDDDALDGINDDLWNWRGFAEAFLLHCNYVLSLNIQIVGPGEVS